MAPLKVPIPQQHGSQLRPASRVDSRSDDEILAEIDKHRSVTSEKNIWAYWHAGLDKMPGWCKRNVANWARICGPEWTIRVIDNVPESPNYSLSFLSAEVRPDCFTNRTMDGPYSGPHAADFLRGACLYTHGGCYMDVGNILIRSLDRVCWDQLADPQSPFQVSVPWMYGITIADHFVAARKRDPFIKRWHEPFCTLWKGRNDYDGLIDNPLIAFGKTLDYNDARASNFKWEYKVSPKELFEYITQVVCWMRLCMLDAEPPNADGTPGFNPSQYWQNNILIFDVLKEDWRAEGTIGFADYGNKLFNDLLTKREPPQDNAIYREADNLVWSLLANSTMQKISHGKGLLDTVQPGTLWDEPENDGKECEPGTFGELLWYGAANYEQTRTSIAYMKVPPPPYLMKKGYLEP